MDNFINADREQLYQLNKLTQFMSNHKGFIAGGCFKNIFNNEKIKDIDIFFEHLHTKKLVLNKEIGFPVSTFERSLKYTKYGYGLCRESKENLIRSIREATLLDGISQGLYDGFD